VRLGEATGACPGIEIMPEVEPWLENLHLGVGLLGSFLLDFGALGWTGSTLTTGLGYGGSLAGADLGARYKCECSILVENMIISMARGNIELEFEGKLIVIECEAYLPGYGSPDFVIYSNSIQNWEPPHESEQITDEERKRILEALQLELKQKDVSFEIE